MLSTEAQIAAAPAAPTSDGVVLAGPEKRAYVRRIFSEIAPRYDLLNHILSANLDRGWRTKAVDALAIERDPSGLYLDLCTGTLDIAAKIAGRAGFRGSVLGVDFAEPMLRAGRAKLRAGVSPVAGDALELPLRDDSVSGAIVAFGIRNVADLDAGLSEVHRVLKPGARFVILEFSTPTAPLFASLYRFYFHSILPRVGSAVSGHPTAYRYLPRSVDGFPEQIELARRMRAAGFVEAKWSTLALGIAAIHVGLKRGADWSESREATMTGTNARSW